MDTQFTVYFDASCGLCRHEMLLIKSRDTAQCLIFVDCSSPSFDDAPFLTDGITREAMMECLHIRDSNGAWIKGVAAFELLYHTVGMPIVAKLWGSRYTRPLAEIFYPWVARHRQLLSWTGVPLLFKFWAQCAAQRADKRSRRCHEGKCSI